MEKTRTTSIIVILVLLFISFGSGMYVEKYISRDPTNLNDKVKEKRLEIDSLKNITSIREKSIDSLKLELKKLSEVKEERIEDVEKLDLQESVKYLETKLRETNEDLDSLSFSYPDSILALKEEHVRAINKELTEKKWLEETNNQLCKIVENQDSLIIDKDSIIARLEDLDKIKNQLYREQLKKKTLPWKISTGALGILAILLII